MTFPSLQLFVHYDESRRSEFDSRLESVKLLLQNEGHVQKVVPENAESKDPRDKR